MLVYSSCSLVQCANVGTQGQSQNCFLLAIFIVNTEPVTDNASCIETLPHWLTVSAAHSIRPKILSSATSGRSNTSSTRYLQQNRLKLPA